jgi:hypothetical protein
METKFIKYKPEQVNLAQIYRFSSGADLSNADVRDGTLVVGYSDNGKYPAMGYLRGMNQSKETGKLLYEIANAIEGQEYLTCIEKPYKVDSDKLPYVVAVIDPFIDPSKGPIIGKIIKCNGELAVIYDGSTKVVVNVNNICQLTPYFKETK